MSALKRIVIIGPESTGKSTISAAIAIACQTAWVPEYARQYIAALDRPYAYEDLQQIALGQLNEESAAKQSAGRLLICDTDLQVIRVWSEHRFGLCALPILQAIAGQKPDLYLLTDIDFPWQPDPQREHPEPHWRQYFFNIYKDIVVQSNCPFAILSGTHDQRLQQALAAIRILHL